MKIMGFVASRICLSEVMTVSSTVNSAWERFYCIELAQL